MMKKYNLIIAFFITLTAFSQRYEGNLNPIKKSGLHKIMLPSKVRSASNDNFNYIRIKDAQKNEVPYVVIHNADKKFSIFKTVPIASKKTVKDSITALIIENKNGTKQDHIILRIANTKIRKSYNVYGSDNGKDWFGLVSDKKLSTTNNLNKTASGKLFLEEKIDFPLNTYAFLRINFNDKNSLPINILEAGIYESKFFTQQPVEITNYKQEITTLKDKKVTQLKFSAANSYKIHTVSFKIDTDFYLRTAKLIVVKSKKVKKRVETYRHIIAKFQLNSKNNNTFNFKNLNENEFIIEIENNDNPPLNINNIQLFQKPIYLITSLKQKQDYNVLINNTLSKPSYDLGNFISNKTVAVEEATILNFTKIEKKKEKEGEKPFWETTLFMWICIVFGGFLVVYFAINLVKDISNQEK
ncbi:hypothetical protein Q4553_12525 [Tenacibaculum soleae]|uniref:hypothetical protein n=1 Tax=Tenacibaculum soleae TaxID=447689 RepID=UPI0026E2D99A|nr:hypothetical protein [Tenacibaculum soleae]MDO6745399.1 hypothetical protein [Tenacibaculum soleae]